MQVLRGGSGVGVGVGDRVKRSRALARAVGGAVEPLEARRLLAANVVISEFLALNDTGIADNFGRRSDWIELHNAGTTDANLLNYRLTDNAADTGKWNFPAVTLPAGGYLVVWASDEDERIPGAPLHTNFQLSGDGGFLGLFDPAGNVVHKFDPYPRQLPDKSYGLAIGEDVTPFIGPAAPAWARVPADGSLGTDWTRADFGHANWKQGRTGVGFEADPVPPPVSGWTVKMVDIQPAPGATDTTIDGIDEATRLLDGNLSGYSVAFNGQRNYTSVNLGSGGSFGGDATLPNDALVSDAGAPGRTDYALRATANVFIPQGNYSLNVQSDDGFRLSMPGVQFLSRYNHDSNAGPGAHQIAWGSPRSAMHTGGAFTVGAGGLNTTVTLDFYERGGGDTVELSMVNAHRTAFSGGGFQLLSDGTHGWAVKASSGSAQPPYQPLIGNDVRAAMHGVNATAYVRVPFTVDADDADPAQVPQFDVLRLRVKYDDGFVAYVNGTEVARRNAGGAPGTPLARDAAAASDRPDAQALLFETIHIPQNVLRVGQNVLAIQGLNSSAADTDFLILPELEGAVTQVSADRYLAPPTPGAANSSSDIVEVVEDTKFSHDRGFYDAPFNLTIRTDTAGAQVRYTTDGSAPTASTGTVYTGPIPISGTTTLRAAAFKPGAQATNVDTQTYLFLNDVIRQGANPPAGFPTSGHHWDYGMDPAVVSAYGSTLINDLKSIPSLSLVMNKADLFGGSGIYSNPGGSGLSWERPGSAEWIYPDGSKESFQIDAGVRIYGGVSRSTRYPKHTFRLLFKKQYGAGKLERNIFDDVPRQEGATDEYDTLIIRGNFNKSWPFWQVNERQMAQYTQDLFVHSTIREMGQPAPHGMFVHLYVDGQYWGLYNPTERPSAPFWAAYKGGEKEDWDALNSSEPVDGDKTEWTQLQNLVRDGDMTSPATYAQVKQLLDVDNLIDYMVANIYGGNLDWDDHNWYAGRKNEPGAGYMFGSWDAERTLESVTQDRSGVNQFDKPSFIYARLQQNLEFRMRFADRLHKYFFNGGVLTPAAATQRLLDLNGIIDRAIVGESARWGDYQRPGQAYTRNVEWISEQSRLVNSYFPQRTNVVLNQFRGRGLYPAANVGAPVFSQHGGSVPSGFNLTMSYPQGTTTGTIYYTLDGSDPRLTGGAVSGTARVYSGGVSLTESGVVKARLYNPATGAWSALNEASFGVGQGSLRVTELNYHPADPPPGSPYEEGDFEFIELKNVAAQPVNLLNTEFTNGVEFTFGNITLAPGEKVVVVRNPAAFESRYGPAAVTGVRIAGSYGGTASDSLSNGGERITLEDAGGTVILDFTYFDDEAGWHPSTDGDGKTLTVTNEAAAPPAWGNPSQWRASRTVGGTPGGDEDATAGVAVTAAAFVHQRIPGQVRIAFDRDVAGTVGQADLVARNVATNDTVSPAAFAYDPATRVATFTFASNIPYGDYRATVAKSAVTAPSGGGLPQDFVLGFSALPGDLNRDRKVDATDFAILAGNFGKTGVTFATGDVNGDGRVDSSDFALLAGHFGRSLPNPPPVTPQTNETLAGLSLAGLSLTDDGGAAAAVTAPPPANLAPDSATVNPTPAPTPGEAPATDAAEPPAASVPPPAPAVVRPPKAAPRRGAPPKAAPKRTAPPRRRAAAAPPLTAAAKGPNINDVMRHAPRR